MHTESVIAELKKNRDAYEVVREAMEWKHLGKTALLSDGVVEAIYNDEGDAYQIGCEKFGLGRFSLQRIGARPVDLGFHALFLDRGE